MSNLPPVLMPPSSQQPAAKRGRGWKIFGVLVTVLLVGSIVANVVMLVMVMVLGAAVNGESPSGRVQSEVVQQGGRDKIAIMPVTGTVDGDMYNRIHNFCQFVKADPSIKAVVLQVDSPGGTVTASDEIYHQFMELKGTGRKISVSMRSLAASGGYYLSMAGDKLYAEPTTLTGSIGVIWPSFQVTELMKRVGVSTEFVKSDAAQEFKDAGSPFKEFTEQDRQYIKGLVNSAHVKFSSVVEAGRKGKLTVPITEVAIGKIWTSDDAKKLGLIDDIAYLDEVCDMTAKPPLCAAPCTEQPLDVWAGYPFVSKVVGPSAVLLRRSALEAVGGWDEAYTGIADWHLWLKLGADRPFLQVTAHTVGKRQHTTSQGRRTRCDGLGFLDLRYRATTAALAYRRSLDLPGDDIAAWERRLEALDGVRQLAGGVVEDDLSIITAAARHIEGLLASLREDKVAVTGTILRAACVAELAIPYMMSSTRRRIA